MELLIGDFGFDLKVICDWVMIELGKIGVDLVVFLICVLGDLGCEDEYKLVVCVFYDLGIVVEGLLIVVFCLFSVKVC